MKPIRIFALSALSVCALLFSCKNEPKTGPAGAEALPSAPPPSPVPEIYLYTVAVDKLNLRKQPNKNAQVITQLVEGHLVEGLGEISANKEEVTLRNVPYNEPYFKVTATTTTQENGWAYSAALVPIYAGPHSTKPDVNELEIMGDFFKSLDVKKLDSGKKAWDYVISHFKGSQGTMSDAVFITLERFLFRMEIEGNFYTLTEKVKWAEEDYMAIHEEKFDPKKYPVTQQLAENGFRLEVGEGMVFPIVDWAKLRDFFATKVTPPMKNYLEQNALEQKNQLYSDGGVVIPLEEVADRAAWWEKFNKANPYFVRSEETRNSQKGLLFILICGADNTPVFGYENQTVMEDFKKVWAYVQEKYAGTELGKSVKEMSDLVTAEGGKKTKKVEALMNPYMGL